MLLQVAILTVRLILGLFLDILFLPWSLLLRCLKHRLRDECFSHPSNDLPPILLVHGSNAGEYQWLMARFWLRKHFNVFTVQIDEQTCAGWEEYSLCVARKVQKIYEQYHQPVLLVGTSMGGLVCAYYAETFVKTQTYVKAICTIGSPFQGAPGLHLYCGNRFKYLDMTPGSRFLKLLNELMEEPEEKKHQYSCFASYYDIQVPAEFAHPTVSDSSCDKLYHPYGHVSVVHFPLVWNYLIAKYGTQAMITIK